jgi:hypothetical protein
MKKINGKLANGFNFKVNLENITTAPQNVFEVFKN